MANEFKVKNGLIVVGDLTTSGTITINGALAATQSWVTSQSYLTSASLSGYATQSYVTSAISALIDAAPAALDTLNELAAALGDDASFSTTVTNSIAGKVAKSGDTMTGSLTFASTADNVRLQKNSSFLNLRDPYNNIHLYNAGDGTYIDSTVHYWRSQAGTHWVALNGTGLGIGTTSPSEKLEVVGSIKAGIAGNLSANIPALRVTSAGQATTQAAIAIQQTYTEGDTIIFADYDQYVEWNFMHENAANQFIIHGGSSNNGLGTNTFYSPNGTAKTGYIKHVFDQTSGNFYVGGNVGIGTSTPSQKFVVSNGSSEVFKVYGGGEVVAGTNYIYAAYSSGTSFYAQGPASFRNGIHNDTNTYLKIDGGTSGFTYFSGNVGIGTTAPDEKLQVAGNIKIQNETGLITDYGPLVGRYNTSQVYVGTGGNYSIVKIGRADGGALNVLSGGDVGIGSTTTSGYKLYVNGSTWINGGTNFTDGVSIFRTQSGAAEVMRIASNSNVGIGINSPQTKLDVFGVDNAPALRLSFPSGNTLNTYTGIVFSGETAKAGILFASNAAGYARGSLIFATSNSNDYTGINLTHEKMRITDGGNVGIGTTNPNEKLHAAGNIHAYAAGGIDAGLFASTSAGSTTIAIRSNGITHFNGGNVGIGTTSPNYKLDVNGSINIYSGNSLRWGSGDAEIINSGYNLLFKTYNGSALAEAMRINSAGKVSIGTTSTNSDKSDFTVYTGGTTTLALSGGEFRVGDTDVNWSVALRQNGVLETYAQNLYLNTVAGNYPVVMQPNGTSSVEFYSDYTLFNGLNLSISRINAAHAANYFRGDSSHLVIGTGGTLYLNYGGSATNITGNVTITGGIGQNNLVGRPYAVWGAGGTTTGAVVIKFPGNTSNYGMVHAVIDIYEYNGNTVSTVIVGGHNWGGSQWYAYGANLVGQTDKQVRVAIVDGAYAIVIGDNSSSWSYGQVVLRKIQNGSYYANVMNVSEGYTVTQTASLSPTWISGDLRQLTVSGVITASGGNSNNWNTAYNWGNHTGLYLPLGGGTLTGDLTLNYGYPRINFYDSGHNPDYSLINNDGDFSLYDITNNVHRLWVSAVGNVGIGTTSPAQKLSVAGNIETVSGTGVKIGFNVADAFTAYGNSVAHYGISYNYGSSPLALSGYFGLGLFTNGTERLSITNPGNVGIGTSSPSSKLHVQLPGSTSAAGILIDTPTNGYETWYEVQNGADYYGRFGVASSNHVFFNTDSAGYRFLTSYGDVVRITNTGNVGIGITSPSEKLHVSGAAIFDGGAGNSSTDSVVYITKSNNNDWGLYVNASGLDYGMYARVSPSAGYAIGVNNGTNWTTRFTGDGRLYLNEKDTIASFDTWLRLNESGHYGSGVYTPGVMRADGGFYVSGNTVIHSGTIGSQSVNYANSAGSASTAATSTDGLRLLREDNRTISPSELTAGYLKFGFTSWTNDNSGPYADFLHLRSYTDASGGNDNLVMFLKNGIGMRIWQQSFGSSSAYSSYADVWTTSNFTQSNVNNWNTAYGWGNHASQGYLTSETDTLQSVTSRGTSTNTTLTSTNTLGLNVNSGSYSYININSTSSWSWVRLSNNGSTRWDIASYDGDALQFRPYGSADNAMYLNLDGSLFINSLNDGKLNLRVPSGDSSDWNYINFIGSNGVRDTYFGTDSGGTPTWWRDDNGVNITLGSTVLINGNTAWHAGNDGSGSGLDADTVDGVQADSIVYGNARGTNDSVTTNNNDLDKTGYYTSDSFATKPSGVANWMYIEHIKLYNANTAYQKQLGYDTYDDRMWVRTKSGGAWSSWKQIWTSDSLTNLSQLTNGPGYITSSALSGYATTSYVTTQINNLINGAPGALDTLSELASALGNDASFATTVTNSIASKLSLSGGTMTGQILFQTSALNNGFRWDVNSDAAGITFKNTGDGDNNSYFNFFTEDNGNEYFKFSHNTWNIGSFDFMDVKNGVVRTNGNIYVNASQSGTRSAGTNELINGNRVWHDGDFSSSNISNWNTAYGWGNHASAGYALNSSLANYLPLSGGVIGGVVTINGNLTVNGTITENSSIKLKENIETSEGNLEKVVNLRPVTYNKIGSQTTELGLIAEEVAEVYPEFVQYDENGEPVGVHYSRLTAALIGAVKELTNQVQELNKKING